jgi:hemerythrin superfamily protein
MPNSRTSRTTSKTTTRRTSTSAAEPNVIDLLEADHKKVKKLFKDFEKLAKQGDDEGKIEVARQICDELTIHAQVEEEIFYPAAHEALKEHELVDEAIVEHATAKDLIAQIQSMDGSEELYDAKVKVLCEYIEHHVQEEEGEIFPKARKAKQLDLEEMAAEITARKEALEAKVKKH